MNNNHHKPISQISNRTAHPVILLAESGPVTLLPDGPPVRCRLDRVVVDRLTVAGDTVPVVQTRYGPIESAPPPNPGTVYIVSRTAAEAAQMPDFVVPDDLVRDDDGRVLGCRALSLVVQ